MTKKQAKWTGIVAAILFLAWLALICFMPREGNGAQPMDTMTVCKTVAIVTVWSNTRDDPTLRIVRADTAVTWDTLPGVKCPGGKP